MKYYALAYGNGYDLLFSEKDMVRAIFDAWNYEADLYLVSSKTTLAQARKHFCLAEGELEYSEFIFCGSDPVCNEDQLVDNYGLRIIDADGEYKLLNIESNKIFDFNSFEKLRHFRLLDNKYYVFY